MTRLSLLREQAYNKIMANICFTEYTFRGEVEAVQRLHDAFESFGYCANLNDVYEKLGGTEDVDDDRATVDWYGEVDKMDGSLMAQVNSAGCTPTDIVSAICDLLGIRANWYSEEPSDGMYEKHDEDDDYATIVYVVEDRENGTNDSFGTLESIIKCNFSEELTEDEIKAIDSIEELEEVINAKREENGEEGISIYEVEEV